MPRPFRPELEALQQNGITAVASARIGDPEVTALWFGEGDTVTPEFIREAAVASLRAGNTFYADPSGKPELRRAITRYLSTLYDIDLDIERVRVPGASMLGVTLAAQWALTPADHALVVGPAWPNIDAAFTLTGATTSHVRQRETADGWQLGADEIIAAMRSNTRALFVNSPCNPTGWIMSADEQAALLGACRERGVLIIADEVYHRTVFDADAAPSFLQVARPDDPVIVVNGFSKAWAMTGWRIGWVVTPRQHAEPWKVLSECGNTGVTVFAQDAAVVALEQGEPLVQELRSQYARGREITMQVLAQHPKLQVLQPDGAFYAFPRLHGLTDSRAFAERVLAETNVGIAPGYTFGPGNDAHFRVCFAQSHARLQSGLERIVALLD